METADHSSESTIRAVTGLPKPLLAWGSYIKAAFVMGVGVVVPGLFLVVGPVSRGAPFDPTGLILVFVLCGLFVAIGILMLRRPRMLGSTEEIELEGRRLKLTLSGARSRREEVHDINPKALAIRTRRGAWEQSLAGEDGEVAETVICLMSTSGKRIYFGGRMDPYERLKLSDRINEHLMALRESD